MNLPSQTQPRPPGWRPLKYFCAEPPQYGLNVSSSEYTDHNSGGLRLLRTTDINEDGSLTFGNEVYINPEGESPNYRLTAGDLLLSRSGTLGRSFLCTTSSPPSTFAGYLIRFRPKSNVDPRYLNYCSRATFFEDGIKANAVSSTIANFNAERYGSLQLPWRPLAEQRAIADYLDAETARIDTLISKKRRLIELLQERRAEVTRAGVTGQLVGNSPMAKSSVPWITTQTPKHWGSPKIGYVAVLGSGHTPSRSVREWWVRRECTIPWITTGEVANLRSDRIESIERTRECVSEIGLANSSAVVHPAGTVVLSRTASVGYSGIMATDMATSQDFATWTCGPSLLPRFLLLCLRAMRPDLLGRLTMGSTHKTIYMPDIQSLAIPLPPIAEQHQIINAVWKQLKRLGPAEDRITAQISLLRESRQALISAAVTGDLATPGLATETPTVRPISP